jgi:outer membrane receptor protein involved in Fe transport
MLKKLLLLSLGIVLMAGRGIAQHQVTGAVKDKSGEGVIAAVVALIQAADSKLVKATVTNPDGTFAIKMVKSGSYKLKIQVLGYKDYVSKAFSVANGNQKIAPITLDNNIESLNEVVVKAEKPMVQVLADKTVFNVNNTINAEGSSGFELLRKAPGIVIDNNDNVIVEGKSGVLFYINGKPSVLRGEDLVNFLKTLQSSDIEAVEIITQPSSKYDAEGNAGIINIKLKRDKSLGTNGTVSAGITVGQYVRGNSSLSFNTRGKKTSFYGAYSNRMGQSYEFVNLTRQQNNTTFGSRSTEIRERNSHNVRMGFDYYMNKRSTLGAMVTGNFSDASSNRTTRTPITPDGSTTPAQVLVAENEDNRTSFNGFANVNYKYEGSKGNVLNIDLDYGQYNKDRNNLQPNLYFNGSETQAVSEIINYFETPVNIQILSGQVNYSQKFLKGVLGMGTKYSLVSTNNNFRFFDRVNGTDVLNTDRTNNFFYDEQIVAGYLNYNLKFKKINIQAGLRMEHTLSDGRLESTQNNADAQVRRDYLNWFPSGGITYKASNANQFALNYSRRIRRPNYQNLNPFEYKLNELEFQKGNPFLQPQYTDNIKLSHTYKYTLTTSLSYSFVSDFSAQLLRPLGDNRTFVMAENVANQRIINLGVAYPARLTKWWSVYLSVNAFRSMFESTDPNFIALSQNSMNLYVQNTFKLPGKVIAQVSGFFNSPTIWGGTFRAKSMGALNLALRKRFMNKKLTASLAFNDVLFTQRWSADVESPGLTAFIQGGQDSRRVTFTVSYNFGRKEIKRARKRKTSIENEKNRIK